MIDKLLKLIKLADYLDSIGLTKQANMLDAIIVNASESDDKILNFEDFKGNKKEYEKPSGKAEVIDIASGFKDKNNFSYEEEYIEVYDSTGENGKSWSTNLHIYEFPVDLYNDFVTKGISPLDYMVGLSEAESDRIILTIIDDEDSIHD